MSEELQGMELCESLWEKYEPQLRRLCNNKLSSHPCEIDDIIADAYLALCNAISNGTYICNYRKWLYGVVSNLIKIKYTEITNYKRRYINLDRVEGDLFYNIDFEDAKISDKYIEIFSEEILDELSATDRTLYILFYEKKLKFKEIAKILNITENAAKQKNYRLKRKIMTIVKEKIEKL